jgi:acyl-CoA synthetase (AMP-forming)/AMP-acid ligase II
VTATIPALVLDAAERGADLPALLASGRTAMTYGALREQTLRTAAGLQAAGIQRRDRVALVVENGPEAASAFVALAAAAACAPLNPAYRESELDFYLRDLGARFVVVSARVDSPVRDVAASVGARVLELETVEGAPAGAFSLSGVDLGDPTAAALPAEPDIALVLHTSGTTARPKIVPLSHRNLALSARSVAGALQLVPDDRCLNVMPLFHIHGLVAALLAPLHAHASVACTPGFHPLRFFEQLAELQPTWYTAVPTMHQAVLDRCLREPELARGHSLRLVRSSSASLPVPTLEALERTLGVPVVEAYGMTEASHQMASNPLPPRVRKPGSVGPAAGPEIAVLGASGAPVPPGEVGEVCIRGDSVFAGYEARADVNAAAFVGGWFRTGDEGVLDEDGYLFLQGRIKEIINRGGEKVGPLEVDSVLSSHPAVAQAVTFGLPDARLGEEVAAAVVLRPGRHADERELQDFVVQRLAPFKVPRKVVFVDEIPKGPTGKVQRIGLADRLRIDPLVEGDALGDVRPRDALENELEKIWADVLGLPRVGVRDDFFALGGDSILGAEAVARVRDLLGVPDLPLISIVRAPTVEAMAIEAVGGRSGSSGTVVPLRAGGSRTPIFFVHGLDGDVVGFAALASRLGSEQPFYALRAPGLEGSGPIPDSVEELAAGYLEDILLVRPRGPYVLGGFCMGAGVAVELTRRLQGRGQDVSLLLLVDPRVRAARGVVRGATQRGTASRPIRSRLARFRPRRSGRDASEAGVALQMAPLGRARDAYRASPVGVPAACFVSPDHGGGELSEDARLVLPDLRSCTLVPGAHGRRFHAGAVDELAASIRVVLDELAARRGG